MESVVARTKYLASGYASGKDRQRAIGHGDPTQGGSNSTMKTRHLLTVCLFTLACGGIVGRLAYLHVVQRPFLQAQGDSRTVREVTLPAYRGMIKDRNGEALAVSTLVDSVWINPQLIEPADPKLNALANLLKVSADNLRKKVVEYTDSNKEFLFVKRHVEPVVAQQALALNLPGVNLTQEYRRYYPNAEVSAHVVGLANVDNQGQEGLELAYNAWLKGNAGKKRIVQDLQGNKVEELGVVADAQHGNDLTLSIDQRLQYLAHRELQNAIDKHQAETGSVVVLDVHTGEVLAMANYPTYNPNKREKDYPANVYRNLAVTDAFEPGSVLKTLSLASVFEHTNITPETTVNTKPGYLRLRGGVVRDLHNNGVLDVASVLRESSNIGITKLVLNLKPKQLLDTYERFGLGWSTNSGFPGETGGKLPAALDDQPFVMATMSFGYGVSATPLQIAQAYAIIGASGVKYPVSFIKADYQPEGEQVLDPKVARQVLDMLTYAVGHSKSNARVSGYRVAGKTGTARVAGPDGYLEDKHRTVFAGLAPAINPRLAIVVAVSEPNVGGYYSNQVAAPVFAQVASGALRLYKIAPDIKDTHGVYVAQNGNNDS